MMFMDCQFPLICSVCDRDLKPDRATLEDHVVETVEQAFGISPKPKQVEVMFSLAFERVDVILTAKTGFGKSLIFNALPAIIGHDGIALIILPLLELEADQAGKLAGVARCRPFVLNGDTNNSQNRHDIGAGKYTHGMSGEMALNLHGCLEVPAKPNSIHES